jgi:prepilin-type N-terminal cleavage/methylation domain-containing protein
MDTEQNDSICRNRLSAGPRQRSRTGGFTLVEIMVATVIFTITSLSLAASLIQNQRFTTALSYRTQALNISMGIVEQLRQISYPNMQAYCKAVAVSASTTTTIDVDIMDPLNASTDYTQNTGAPPNYRRVQLPFQLTLSTGAENLLGAGATAYTSNSTTNWYQTAIPMDLSKSAQQMPIRWWLTVYYNVQTGAGTACDAFEMVLIYQWQIPGTKSPAWQSGTIRLINPNDLAS